jgi:hypothetical protein
MTHKANGVGRSFQLPQGTPLSTRSHWGNPHRANCCRRACCAADTGTWPKVAWGENDRAEHGPGVFIRPTQPGDLLAAAQAELFDGVHLPDRMGLLRGWRCRGGPASGRGRRLLGPLHPALQRPRAGKPGKLGMKATQLNEQVGCTPRGVLLVQEQGLLHHRTWHEGVGLPVSGFQGLVAVLAELATELTNRARYQAETAGNDGGVGASLKESEDALPQRLGHRRRHDSSLKARRMGDGPIRKH